jgi:thioredoxin reductase
MKDRCNSNYSSGAADWLRHRIHGKVTLHEGRTVNRIAPVGSGSGLRLRATLSDGAELTADHLLLATGFRIDIGRLTMLDPSLRKEIRTTEGVPVLNSRFETTVPGLYFAGMTTLPAFGPLYRFVAGAPATARRIAGAIVAPRSQYFGLPDVRLNPTGAGA